MTEVRDLSYKNVIKLTNDNFLSILGLIRTRVSSRPDGICLRGENDTSTH